MRKLLQNAKGFTIAEVAASLGIIALVASVISPIVGNTSTSVSGTQTITVADSTVMAEPETLPVEAILVNVTNTATGKVTPKTVNDPNATSTVISGLDPQGNYTVEVAKKSQAGVSPKATAKVNYTKIGEKTVETRTPRMVNPAQSTSRTGSIGVRKVRDDVRRIPQPNKQVLKGYQKKTISVAAHYVTSHTVKTRQVAKSRQVRIAPFERAVTKSRGKYVAPYSYTYSCTKTRSVSYSYACGTNPTYSYACGSTSYSYACGSYPTYRYACGSYSYRCGKRWCSGTRYCTGGGGTKYCTGSQTKYCTGGGGTKYCNGTRNESYSSTCTGSGGGYWTTETYTDYEPIYNYRTENYTETESYTESSRGATSEGACTWTNYSGSNGGASCTNTTMSKQVDDTSKPIYDSVPQPPKVETASVEEVYTTPAGACPAGWTASTGIANPTVMTIKDGFNGTKTVVVSKQVVNCFKDAEWTEDIGSKQVEVKKAVTTAKEVKAPAGQLVIEVAGTPTRSWRWATGTVAAVGNNASGFAVGDTVNFRMGQVFTFNGKKYIKVPAKSYLAKK